MLLPLPCVCQTTPPLWRLATSAPGREEATTWLIAAILEEHEEAQIVEQLGRRQHATNHRLQLVELTQRIERQAINRPPLHEALGVAGQRTQPCLAAVRNHQQLVVLDDIGNLFLVGLDLVVGFPDIGLLVGRVLQLQQHQRQAIDEQDHIRPAGVVQPFDGELIDRQPAVLGRVFPVNQANEVTTRFALFLVFHWHTADQQFVEMAIGRKQGRDAEVQHLLERIFFGGSKGCPGSGGESPRASGRAIAPAGNRHAPGAHRPGQCPGQTMSRSLPLPASPVLPVRVGLQSSWLAPIFGLLPYTLPHKIHPKDWGFSVGKGLRR